MKQNQLLKIGFLRPLGFSDIKRPGVFLPFYSPLDVMLVHDYPPELNLPVPINAPGWREAL